MSRQLLEDIRGKLLGEAAKIILKDREMKEVQKVVSRAVGKNVDMRMSDSDVNTGAIDFGGLGKYDIFVDSEDGDFIEGDTANDYRSALKLVTKLAKKHKKNITS